MKRYKKRPTTQITREVNEEGHSLEEIIRNALNNPNGIDESAPPMYTEKSAGVLPECDIRTDKQLLAIEACDKFTKSRIAKQEGISLAKKQEETDEKNPQTKVGE